MGKGKKKGIKKEAGENPFQTAKPSGGQALRSAAQQQPTSSSSSTSNVPSTSEKDFPSLGGQQGGKGQQKKQTAPGQQQPGQVQQGGRGQQHQQGDRGHQQQQPRPGQQYHVQGQQQYQQPSQGPQQQQQQIGPGQVQQGGRGQQHQRVQQGGRGQQHQQGDRGHQQQQLRPGQQYHVQGQQQYQQRSQGPQQQQQQIGPGQVQQGGRGQQHQQGDRGHQQQQPRPGQQYPVQGQQQYQQPSQGPQQQQQVWKTPQQYQQFGQSFQQQPQALKAQQHQHTVQGQQQYQQPGQSPQKQHPGLPYHHQEEAKQPPQTTQPGFGDQKRPSSGDVPTAKKISEIRSSLEKTSLNKEIVPGQKGRRIPITTNHLSLDLGKLTTAYHYDVDIDPDRPKKLLRDVISIVVRKNFRNRYPAFDGMKNLYSPIELMDRNAVITEEVSILDPSNEREKNFKVKIKFANEVDLTPLHNIMNQVRQRKAPELSPQEAIQVVEIVLRNAPSIHGIQAGRSFFFRPPRMFDLGEGMEMYSGFYQSVIRGWKPLLNVDVAHKAFPKEMKVIDAIIEVCSTYFQKLNLEDLVRGLDNANTEKFKKFMYSLRIVYEISNQPGSKRQYRVNGLDICPRNKKFRLDNGPEITIEQYYLTNKGYRLKYPLLPTLWVGSMQRKDKILLPPELCTILPGQAINRKMTDNQTSSMIRFAATNTDVRKNKIMDALSRTNHNNDMCVKEFGFRIGTEFEKITARVLDAPALAYSAGKVIQPRQGVWRQDNAQFLRGCQINAWTIISACGPQNQINDLANQIYNLGPRCGINITARAIQPFDILRGKIASRIDIEKALSKQKYDLVFLIIPDSGSTYSDVKKSAELRIGCITQCIRRRTMNKLNPSTVNNILLKVNSKLNGTNHRLNGVPLVLKRPCMIMGADVTHPAPDSQNVPSVAAVTASYDPAAFCYNICCRLQNPRLEVIGDLQNIVKEQLMYFYQKNKQYKPERVIFFRDGVSEGQFTEIRRVEIMAIRNACSSLEEGYQPKITFLVVQKRHHTRFFPQNKKDSEDRNMNVPAGTCVDTDITNPMMQDFYLVSHASIQGVAKPTKYCTLWDDNDMSNDEIEELTYHLCHLFARCNRSVSYPAPTYYAHLAAARAKVYIENERILLTDLDREQRKIEIREDVRLGSPMFFV